MEDDAINHDGRQSPPLDIDRPETADIDRKSSIGATSYEIFPVLVGATTTIAFRSIVLF